MIERGPKESSEIRQPATITTGRATATERAVEVWAADIRARLLSWAPELIAASSDMTKLQVSDLDVKQNS